MPVLSTELITKILKLYFHVDVPSTLIAPSDIVLSHAATLRLVDSTFLDIIDESYLLYRSVCLRTDADWLRYFDHRKGALVKGKKARRRCKAVRELLFSFSAPEFPLRLNLCLGDVGSDPYEFRYLFTEWFAPLSIPAFSPNVRYIDLETKTAYPYTPSASCIDRPSMTRSGSSQGAWVGGGGG
jgi:hypothetical protein